MTMKHALLLASICVLPPATSVDAQVVAFRADFNQDMVGEEPNLTPPGAPSGDAMSLNTVAGTITVEDAFGVMTDKPLVMNRTTTGAFTVQGILDPAFRTCDNYVVTWTAMITEATDNVGINFRNETNSTMASFQYQPDGALSYNGFQNELVTGYAPNVPQTFELTIDLLAETTSLSIDGVSEPNAQNKPFVFPNFSGTFGSFLIGFAGLEYEEFIIDDIEVTSGECGVVPTEESTWSRLKVTFE